MRPGTFFWKLFLGNAVLLALTLAISVWLIVVEFDRFQAAQLTPILHAQTRCLLELVEHRFDTGNKHELQELVGRIASNEADGLRITLIAANGEVLADSQHDPTTMENHAARPEVLLALRHGVGESERWSSTISRTMKYVASRVGPADNPAGYVRMALPIRTLAQRALAARRILGPLGLILLVSALALAIGLALLWSSRLRRLTAAGQRLARGDLDTSIPASGSDEVAVLARSLERMRVRLSRQVSAIKDQRQMLESLVNQLDEGVVAVNARGLVVLMNPAARQLLGFAGLDSVFLPDSKLRVEQVVMQHDLQRMLLEGVPTRPDPERGSYREPLEQPNLEPIRLDLPDSPESRYVLAKACPIGFDAPSALKDDTGAGEPAQNGRLLVMSDVTALMRAIKSRSDFVANASHELRTPVAAIAVAAETLQKLDLSKDQAAGARFAEVIARHAARLDALVRDLLDLARVESPGARFEPSKIHLQRVIDELHTRWQEELNKKNLHWCGEVAPEASDLVGSVQLLSLILDNLVDNAVKFTPSGGGVSVRAVPSGDSIVIEVSDSGCGIPKKDQQRVFERFYQVDSVRTGTGNARRGTGLGLSIVRHAVLAMGGEIRLESEVDQGTQVKVTLPKTVPSMENALNKDEN